MTEDWRNGCEPTFPGESYGRLPEGQTMTLVLKNWMIA